ncbi:MAG TPA: beta-1-3, beta-1-6-glucan biosynthesis protein [Xanthobacteraceae bacterium]|nr:beta-1-3, beta-1-6-glucan biosynthesis protein [Xanthobacteraceae bacterium]
MGARTLKWTMLYRKFSVAGTVGAALLLLATAIPSALAQSTDPKPAEKPPAAAQENGKEVQKVDEFAEAQHAVSGPAGNPECVWLGRRVVSLLWRDDLDTAFRHLDLYDRFGCPSAHIQASFRCLIQHGASIDPKAADSLNARIQACWINPSQPQPAAPAPAAAASSPTSNR